MCAHDSVSLKHILMWAILEVSNARRDCFLDF